MSKSKIEWTEATWNPIVGCSIVSPGCTNCYAMKMAARIEAMSEAIYDRGERTAPAQYCGTTKKVNGNAVWTGEVHFAGEDTLRAPLKRNKPTTYFVNSMGDLFHEDVPVEWIDRVFAVMGLAAGHTFQVLTKRAERMHWYMTEHFAKKSNICDFAQEINGGRTIWSGTLAMQMGQSGFFRNIWLGVSTERQQEADERIPLLVETPAAKRFISAEPLLGPVDLSAWLCDGHPTQAQVDGPMGMHYLRHGAPRLDWVIAGGESGPGARPMHPDWVREIRDDCETNGVPFFFKQWGQWKPLDQFTERLINERVGAHAVVDRDGPFIIDTDIADPPNRVFTFRLGKKGAGRLLDGKLHDAMPNLL